MPRSTEAVREEVRRLSRVATDAVALHRAVAAALSDAVPFDRWCGLVLDPATMLVTSGYHAEGLPGHLVPRLLEIEAADADVNGMPVLARRPDGVSTIDRATHGQPETSQRWRDVLEPGGLGRELRAVLRERTTGWGGFVLLRETGSPDFSDAELALVASLAEDFARGIRRSLLQSELVNRDAVAVPGMVVVAAAGYQVELCTAAAQQWLDVIDDGRVGGGLPYVLATLVARARSSGLARTRLRTREGTWLSAFAEELTEDRVAVVLEPTRPYELATIMADAYQLTPRERAVTAQVLLGRSTQEIASALFLSSWTVQDHLKKVFDKVGVRSRSELTSRLFFGHYEPRLLAGAPLGADGWFIDP